MKINRHSPPALHPPGTPTLIPHRDTRLGNGMNVTCLHDPLQETCKIDLVLPHGIYHQPRPLLASTTINLLNEGTGTLTAAEIAEFFDFHGASIELHTGMHHSTISILSLREHAGKMIEMLATMILESAFPRREMEIFTRNKKQQHEDNMGKTSYLAQRAFSRLLHGEQHPYANHFTGEDFDRVTTAGIREFYRARLSATATRVILSGNVDEAALLPVVERAFSSLPPLPLAPDEEIPPSPASPGIYRVDKPKAVQASIRVGKEGARLHEEDYIPFLLLNTVLGGYFGSRLMSNIREEKGYTYGIHSANVNLERGAYWMISTEVNAGQANATVDEIRKEITRLQEKTIPDDELRLVKSYYHGEILRELDGVYAQAGTLRYYLEYGLDLSFYLRALESVKACTPARLLEIARERLPLDKMIFVIAGGEQ
ncbi:MAG: insulinase family protein [Odoribacteraceae bacterium]|jgi:predicted Zn-dependent peptidase|nr:insulinase family protein [Odoribacteraceae bacterium]